MKQYFNFSIKRTVFLLMLLITVLTAAAQPGAIDPTFNPGDIGFGNGDAANSSVSTTAIQTDGKIIIGGLFTTYNGTSINRIARLNSDGSLDATFIPGTGANNTVNTTAIQTDGKIIIGGDFTTYNGTGRNYIARLNSDGSLDATFDPGTGANNIVYTTAIQTDGKIIIGGDFTAYNGTALNRIARLNSDGSLDATFNPGTGAGALLYTTAIQTDGKIIISGQFTTYNGTGINRIARLNSDGSLDVTFIPGTGADNTVFTTAIQTDGKIIIGGDFTSYNGIAINRIARLNSDGSFDASFNQGTGTEFRVNTTFVQSDGKIIIGGQFFTYNGTARRGVARINSDGSLDVSFNPGTGANSTVSTTAVQIDGKIIIGGDFTTYNGTGINRIARLNSDGNLDATFTPGTGANSLVYKTAIQTDGKIIIGGGFTAYNGTLINHIARINSDGSIDATFNPGTGANNWVYAIAIQADGKIIIGGQFSTFNGTATNRIARLNSDGSIDATFNPGTGASSMVRTTAIQTDGKIIIGGDFITYNGTGRNCIARINSDGSLDATFNPGTGANNSIYATAIQTDGKIIISGSFTTYNGTARIRIALLNSDGSLDASFNPGTGANSLVNTTAIQTDGKIIIGGQFTTFNGTGRNRIARLNSDGTRDATFNPGTGADNIVYTTAIQTDGKIIIGGQFTTYNGTGRNRIARLNSNGSIDATFDPGTGAGSIVRASAIQTDGKIIIGGDFTAYNGTGRNRIARVFGNTGVVPVSFLSFNATQKITGNQLAWKIAEEQGIIKYDVYRSPAGADFTKIHTAEAAQVNNGLYNWFDAAPHKGANFYRIGALSQSGRITYSAVVKLITGSVKGAITIAPNPVTGSTLNLQFTDQEKGNYAVRILNNAGMIIYRSVITHTGGSSVQGLVLPPSVAKGIYHLEILKNDNSRHTQKLVVAVN